MFFTSTNNTPVNKQDFITSDPQQQQSQEPVAATLNGKQVMVTQIKTDDKAKKIGLGKLAKDHLSSYFNRIKKSLISLFKTREEKMATAKAQNKAIFEKFSNNKDLCQTKGVFRVPGNVADVKKFRNEGTTNLEGLQNVSLLASVFKANIKDFISKDDKKNILDMSEVHNSLVKKGSPIVLPKDHELPSIVQDLVKFSKLIEIEHEVNQMTAWNIAMSFGPQFISNKGEPTIEDVQSIAKINNFLAALITDTKSDER